MLTRLSTRTGSLCRLAIWSLTVFAFASGGVISACRNSNATPTYEGREGGAQWRRSAEARIEKIRKGDLKIVVTDRGVPVSGAKVRVDMLRHSFAFGAAVTAHDLTDRSPDGDRYRDIVERSYNKVTLENDLKWGTWEQSARRKPGAFYNRDSTSAALKWLRDREIAVRGHYVAWGNLEGDTATVTNANRSPDQFRTLLLRHAEQEVREVNGAVAEWDVVNHPFGWVPRTIRDVAGADIYDVMFDKVREWNPGPRRDINEGGILSNSGRLPNRNRYFSLVQDMLRRGVPVQGVGFMGHFFSWDLTPPTTLLEILDQYSALKLPLQVTEFDVRFGKAGEMVKLTPEEEQLQADYMRDFLTAMFSHPAVTGVVMWGFWEGRDWYPAAALYRKDWTLKPNGRAWEDLVLRQWWTKESGTTDKDGRFATRGFLGDYIVRVQYGKREVVKRFKLPAPGTTVRVALD